MTKKDWRTTLFVWDGILSFVEKDDDEEEKNESDSDSVGGPAPPAPAGGNGGGTGEGESVVAKWKGTWVGFDFADATQVPAPKRGAFDEYVSSENQFEVRGIVIEAANNNKAATTAIADDGNKKDDTNGVVGNYASSPLRRVSMTLGSGYDLGTGDDKKRHTDTRHDVYFSSALPSLRWRGNLRNQIENVVLALGENEFGRFVSVGWLRVGNRVTLARRHVDESDERAKWDIDDLRKAVFDQIIIAKTAEMEKEEENGTATVKLVIPPWQCAVMHADAGRVAVATKRQKIAKE